MISPYKRKARKPNQQKTFKKAKKSSSIKSYPLNNQKKKKSRKKSQLQILPTILRRRLPTCSAILTRSERAGLTKPVHSVGWGKESSMILSLRLSFGNWKHNAELQTSVPRSYGGSASRL